MYFAVAKIFQPRPQGFSRFTAEFLLLLLFLAVIFLFDVLISRPPNIKKAKKSPGGRGWRH